MISQEVTELCKAANTIYVASANQSGQPHLAVADNLVVADAKHVIFSSWVCPQTVENLHGNPEVALVVWNVSRDHGYQLLGQVEKIEDVAFLNGYVPDKGEAGLPQIESRLTIRIDKILRFCLGPHSDQEMLQ